MNYTLVLTAHAEKNAADIEDWIDEWSPEGADRWHDALQGVLDRIVRDPRLSPLAPENASVDEEIRNAFFHTRRGRTYRVVFYVSGDTVTVTHIRGPRQQLIPPDEFRFE